MKMKKLLSILLIISMMAVMLGGCGKSEEISTNQNKSTADTQSSTDSNTAADTSSEAQEPAKIVVALMTLAPMDSSKTDAVEAYVNKITQEKINVTVDLQWYDAATYGTQVPMMLQANEQLDLMNYTPVPSASYSSFMMQNQLMDISSLLDQYGSDIKSTLGDMLTATTSDKGTFGVGNYGPLSSFESICMRKDILDQLGLTDKANNMQTWSDFEAILKEVVAKTDLSGVVNSDAEGTVISPMPYVNGGDNFSDAKYVDTLGDSYNIVYADTSTDKVVCNYLTDDFYNTIKRAKTWYDEGLIYKDASTASDYGDTLLKNQIGFAKVVQGEGGLEQSLKSSTGFDFIVKNVVQGDISTGAMRKFGFAVPVTSKESEAAVKFLNLLYADQDLSNTLAWGIEGTDWVKNDNGEATYPDGVTAETVTYHTMDFLYGNRFLTIPWDGNKAIREEEANNNKTAQISKYMGFSIDTTNVADYITACNNVINQYKPSLEAGSADNLDKEYNAFKEKLQAAGIDKILTEYQTQLDAWLAKQK